MLLIDIEEISMASILTVRRMKVSKVISWLCSGRFVTALLLRSRKPSSEEYSSKRDILPLSSIRQVSFVAGGWWIMDQYPALTTEGFPASK